MNRLNCVTITLLIFALATLCACNSGNDKTSAQQAAGTKPGGTQSPASIPSISGQNTVGAPTASPQDQAAVRAAALHVMNQMESGEFAQIYQAASPGFQKIGSETAFTAKFLQTRQKTGALNNPREVSYVTLPNGAQVVVYRSENDRFTSERRLTFSRAKSGQLILEGLNQHDELKK